MALAKLGLLSKVCSVYPMLTISETVYPSCGDDFLTIGTNFKKPS